MTLFFQTDDIVSRVNTSGMSPLEYMLDQAKRRKARLYGGKPKTDDEYKPLRPGEVRYWTKRQRESWERMVVMAFSMSECDRIMHEAAAKTGVSIKDLKSDRRFKPIVNARHYVCWKASKETTLSLPAIGRRLGDKDHTTVLHGIRRFQAALDRREEWAVMLAGVDR